MKKPLILLWLCILPGVLFSQKGYSPGYIITNSFDTIHGVINLKANNHNRRVCDFIETGSLEPIVYNPDELRGFRIANNKFYLSKEIEVDSIKQKVFLEYLVDGIIDLYYLKTIGSEYYFIEKDNIMTLLSNESHLVSRTEKAHDAGEMTKTYQVNSERYKNILRYLFQDSPGTVKKVQGTTFSYRPLINIAVDYHNDVCKDQTCINFTKSTIRTMYLEPFIGMVSSGMHLQTSKDVASNTVSYAGFRLRLQPLKSYSLWNLITGANYSKNEFSADFVNRTYMQTVPNDRLTRIFTRYSIIRIPFQLERTFSGKKIQPMISAGINSAFLLDNDYSAADVATFAHPEPAEIETKMRNIQIGFSAGAGVRFLLDKGSYIYFKSEFERRSPLTDAGFILDKHWVNSLLLCAGYGFRIR